MPDETTDYRQLTQEGEKHMPAAGPPIVNQNDYEPANKEHSARKVRDRSRGVRPDMKLRSVG